MGSGLRGGREGGGKADSGFCRSQSEFWVLAVGPEAVVLYKHPCKGCSPSQHCSAALPVAGAEHQGVPGLKIYTIFTNNFFFYFGIFSPEAHENT